MVKHHKNYKKTCSSLPKKISMETKKTTKSFNIDNKMDIMTKRQCFVTIKDHEENFRVNLKYSLLNTTKSELRELSKHILQRMSTTNVNCESMAEFQRKVTKRFKNIKKQKLTHVHRFWYSRILPIYQWKTS